MDFLKSFFESSTDGRLSYDDLQKACSDAGLKLADLSKGDYVSKVKFDNEIQVKDNTINTLNTTIKTRDTDLLELKKQLESAGVDQTKLKELSDKFTNLQGQYDNDTKTFKAQLSKQAYEFAVKEYANELSFTSKAAKRDFINSMIAKELKLVDNKIENAEIFKAEYSKENSDAFAVSQPQESDTKPKFVDTLNTEKEVKDDNPFKFDFYNLHKQK